MKKICALFGFKRSLFESFNNKRVLEKSWADQVCVNIRKHERTRPWLHLYTENQDREPYEVLDHCHITTVMSQKSLMKFIWKSREKLLTGKKKNYQGKANKETNCLTPDHPLSAMSDLCSESSDEEQGEIEERPRLTRMPIIQLIPRSSPGGSPKNSPKDSPRGSPRNSPLLFRKLLMNRSINLQRRRFTLAHTPR